MGHSVGKSVLAVSVVMLPAWAGGDDLTIVSKVNVGKDAPKTATQYVSRDRIRHSDGDNDTIIEYASGRIVMINHKKKEYFETSMAEMGRHLQEVEAQMQGNPVVEKMMGKVSEVEVQKVSGVRSIAGYDTQQYVLSMGDSLKFDVWVAPALEAPTQYYDARKAAYAGMGPMGQRFEKMFDEMRKLKGMPLAMGVNAKTMMLKQETFTEAVEVRKGSVPPSAFEIPVGYKKKESPFRH